jgi:hypothetical protein
MQKELRRKETTSDDTEEGPTTYKVAREFVETVSVCQG